MYADEAVKKSEHLKRENDRLRNLAADLSQQVGSQHKHFTFSHLKAWSPQLIVVELKLYRNSIKQIQERTYYKRKRS